MLDDVGLEVRAGQRRDRRLECEVDSEQAGEERDGPLRLPLPPASCERPISPEIPDARGDTGCEDEQREGPELPVEQRGMQIEIDPFHGRARHPSRVMPVPARSAGQGAVSARGASTHSRLMLPRRARFVLDRAGHAGADPTSTVLCEY